MSDNDQTWGRELVEELRRKHAAGDRGSRGGRSVTAPRGGPVPGQVHGRGPARIADRVEERAEARPLAGGPLASDQQSADARAASETARARQMLERARWAARAYVEYGKDEVDRIVVAVAEAAAAHAEEYAERAVSETGFGVVEHKVRKNLACSVGLLDEYSGHDYVSPRVDEGRKIVEIPRPAGVVLALTPSTNPVATTFFKVILALMTRNAVVVSPHPMAKGVCAAAARTLAEAAEAAGAPSGIVQCVEEPTIPLVEALMGDARTGVIVATGGTGVVRSAYSSGNPALGVGPGNVPVLVDATADVRAAARAIVESKAFDNSVLCTNESVLVVEESVADRLLDEMQRQGAQLLTADEVERLTAYMYPMGRLNTDVVGRDASVIAEAAGIRSSARTKVLLAPFDAALPEEMMSHEKLSPVLGVLRVPDARRGITAAAGVVRVAGAGHSAAIHSTDPDTILAYTTAVPVLRVSVNVGNSTGGAGLDTNLAPTMTIGTGFVGRSSIGENLEPKHLVNWARIAYNADDDVPMADFRGVVPTHEHHGAVPAYPWPSNDPRHAEGAPPPFVSDLSPLVDRVAGTLTGQAGRLTPSGSSDEELRAEVRRLVAAELSAILKG